MNIRNKLIVAGLTMIFGVSSSVTALAASTDNDDLRVIQNQYSQYVENGKSYKDAYEALAYEIAYETAAVQAKKPCRKMVRGL